MWSIQEQGKQTAAKKVHARDRSMCHLRRRYLFIYSFVFCKGWWSCPRIYLSLQITVHIRWHVFKNRTLCWQWNVCTKKSIIILEHQQWLNEFLAIHRFRTSHVRSEWTISACSSIVVTRASHFRFWVWLPTGVNFLGLTALCFQW